MATVGSFIFSQHLNREAWESLQLIDLSFEGLPFTWSNLQDGYYHGCSRGMRWELGSYGLVVVLSHSASKMDSLYYLSGGNNLPALICVRVAGRIKLWCIEHIGRVTNSEQCSGEIIGNEYRACRYIGIK